MRSIPRDRSKCAEIHESPRPTTAKIPALNVQDDELRAAQSLLERELVRPDITPAEAEALREVLFGLRERNYARVATIWRAAVFWEAGLGAGFGVTELRSYRERDRSRPSSVTS